MARHLRGLSTKIFRVMKHPTTFLMLLPACTSLPPVTPKGDHDGERYATRKVFAEVITQTGVSIVYSENVLSNTRPVSLNVKDVTVQQLLELCLKDQQVMYALEGNSFVIKKLPDAGIEPVTSRTAADTTITQTGKITASDNSPLPGATILIKGTARGTNQMSKASLC